MADPADLTAAWPPALRTLAALCGGGRLPPGTIAWDRVAALATGRHRVAPAVLQAVDARGIVLPGDGRAALAAAAADAARAALLQKAETLRIARALAAEGIRPVLLKGWPVAETLYGAAGGRHAKDLDLLIAPAELDRTVAVLAGLGFAGARTVGAAFRSENVELALRHPVSGVEVELHWRTCHFHAWPELLGLSGAFAEHPLDATGTAVRVLSPPALMLYLSLHGQQHAWLRLKWLLDIARLAAARPAEALCADLRYAERAGAGRPVRLAVRLAAAVFASPVPAGWPAPCRLESQALARFVRLIAAEHAEPGSRAAKVAFYRTALRLAETGAQRLGVLRYLLWRRLRPGAAG